MNNGGYWPILIMIGWIGGIFYFSKKGMVLAALLWGGCFPIIAVVIVFS